MEMIGIASYGLCAPAAPDKGALLSQIRSDQTGLSFKSYAPVQNFDYWAGVVSEVESQRFEDFGLYDTRLNRLIALALDDPELKRSLSSFIARGLKIGIVFGTSTSGIESTEFAYRKRMTDGAWGSGYSYRNQHAMNSPIDFIRRHAGIGVGPSMVISTACSSSLRVFGLARSWLQLGIVDAVLVGGGDSLCSSTLLGFNALQLISERKCMPFDQARTGISIGESAGFALLHKETEKLYLAGVGGSLDSYHMSSPCPDGAGAADAMRRALDMANLSASDVDYVNCHGTGTQNNDLAEARALAGVFQGADTRCSSTKGITGHTLGGAGITEAIISMMAIDHGLLPGNVGAVSPIDEVDRRLVLSAESKAVNTAMCNNFGFGGNNYSAIFRHHEQ